MQKNLLRIVYACLVLVPFVAWYVSDGRFLEFSGVGDLNLFFPFITGKNLLFRFFVEIGFVAWMALAFRYEEYRPRVTLLLKTYSVFLLVLFVADCFGVDPVKSFFSNFERMEGFVTHVHLFAYFVMLTAVLRSRTDWLKYFRWTLVSNVVVLLWGYLQLIGSPQFVIARIAPTLATKFNSIFQIHQSAGRLDSTLGNSAYFAIYTVMFIAVALVLYFNETRKKWRVIYIVLALLNLIALYYTATRGAQLGLIGGAIVGLVYVFFTGSQKQKKVSATILGVFIALGLVFFAIRDTSFVANSPVLSRFAHISASSDITTRSRLMLWRMSYNGFKEHPILGWGQDNFIYVFSKYYDPNMFEQEPWFDRSHDVFFDWLIAGGVLGLVAYLGLFVSAGVLILKKNNLLEMEKAVLIGALVAYFIHNMLVFDNLVSYIFFFMLLAFLATQSGGEHVHQKRSRFFAYSYLEILVWLAVFIVFLYSVYRPLIANRALISAIDTQALFDKYPPVQALAVQKTAFETALSTGPTGKVESREQLLQAALRDLSIDPNNVAKENQAAFQTAQKALLDMATAEVAKMTAEPNKDAREYDIFGSFFLPFQAYDQAANLIGEAHTLSPKKQLISFNLIQAYLGQKNFAKSYELAKSTYLDVPRYETAQRVLAAVSIPAGKVTEAQTLFHQYGFKLPYTENLDEALRGVSDQKLVWAYLDALLQDYSDKKAQIEATRRSLQARF